MAISKFKGRKRPAFSSLLLMTPQRYNFYTKRTTKDMLTIVGNIPTAVSTTILEFANMQNGLDISVFFIDTGRRANETI